MIDDHRLDKAEKHPGTLMKTDAAYVMKEVSGVRALILFGG